MVLFLRLGRATINGCGPSGEVRCKMDKGTNRGRCLNTYTDTLANDGISRDVLAVAYTRQVRHWIWNGRRKKYARLCRALLMLMA
jgi:hypothetical protein